MINEREIKVPMWECNKCIEKKIWIGKDHDRNRVNRIHGVSLYVRICRNNLKSIVIYQLVLAIIKIDQLYPFSILILEAFNPGTTRLTRRQLD